MISPKYIAMKKQLLLAFLMSISCLMTLMGQSAKKSLNYQAVILDPKSIDIPGVGISGQPLSKGKVCLKFTFLNSQGNVDYEETQQTTTDEYGLISLSVGTGSYSNGTYKNFESIIWDANVKSMKVAVSYDGCATFKQVSTQSINYTAYALYAEAVDYKNVREAPTKLSQFSNDAGYLIPRDLDPIKTDIKNNTNQIATANQTIADNKKSSDQSFLLANQSISNLDMKVAENTTAIKENTGSISTINSTLTDQQNQIYDNRNQISSTNSTMNDRIGGLQGQINTTNSTVSNLTGAAELLSNKSTNVQTDATSDTKYPTVKALKVYVDKATLGVALATDLQGISSDLQRFGNEKANIASPTFTGTPALPTGTTGVTQSAGNNSTKLATTAFVNSAVQNYLPKMSIVDRNAIASPSAGLTIWNIDNKQLEVYDGSYWVNMIGKLVSTLNIGDSYGGGKVAYIFTSSDPGYIAGQTHGLIAAISDQTTDAVNVKWFPTSSFYGATAISFGQGSFNTLSIITAAGTASLSSYAAGLASSYRGGGYSDWYLPSKEELNKLYINRASIGGFAISGTLTYWSSSQNGSINFTNFTTFANGITSGWLQNFSDGTQSDTNISNTRRVRAVRTF